MGGALAGAGAGDTGGGSVESRFTKHSESGPKRRMFVCVTAMLSNYGVYQWSCTVFGGRTLIT